MAYPSGPPTVASNVKSESADSRAAPWRTAQAAMTISVAGTVIPRSLLRRARSQATLQTSSSMGSSGSVRTNSRRTLCSRCPRAPFQSSSCTSGHQRACPVVRAASTRARTVGSPPGRSMCIQDEVSTRINRSAFSAGSLQLLGGNQVGAGPCMSDKFRHPHAAVEVLDYADDCLAFGLRLREPDGILEFTFRNIQGRLHDARLSLVGIRINHSSILHSHAWRAKDSRDTRHVTPVRAAELLFPWPGPAGRSAPRRDHASPPALGPPPA